MTLTSILPQHIVVAVVQHRLVRRILGYHKLVAVHKARHIPIVKVGTCIDKRFLMICFLHHCQKCHQRIAESIVRQSLLCLYINHRYQVLLRGAALSLKVLKLQLKGRFRTEEMIRTYFQSVLMRQLYILFVLIVYAVASFSSFKVHIRHLGIVAYCLPKHFALIVA